MSEQLPAPAASNTFERIKRVSAEGHESWSARDLGACWNISTSGTSSP
jgi:hypothetical protein